MRPVDPARSRIVLVGTSAYDDSALPDVPEVANNLADLAAVLTHPDLGGFSPEHCVVASARASVAEVGDLLVSAAEQADDLLLFYFSGHGVLGPLRRELYLGLAATRQDRLAFSALPFDAVRDACLASRARARVVILDSCYSGRAIGETLAGEGDSVLGQIQVSGTYTLTSAPANRTAVVLPGERNTAFTGRMLSLLRNGSASAGSLLSLGDIYRHLYTALMAEGLPLPQQRGTETADQLGLVRNIIAARALDGEISPPVTSIPVVPVPVPMPAPAPEPAPAPAPALAPAVKAAADDAGWDVFHVTLEVVGNKKIQVIKAVRDVAPYGLREAKDLVDGAPARVLLGTSQETAAKAKAVLEGAGATVTVDSEHVVLSVRSEGVRSADDVGWDVFDVILEAPGSKQKKVMQAIYELIGLHAANAIDLINDVPALLLRRVDKHSASYAKTLLEQAGARVALRSEYVVPAPHG